MTEQQADGAQAKFESARLVVEVMAGVVPKRPEPEHTRRYVVTSRQWQESTDQGALLAEVNGKAAGYAALLMLQPDRLNWVRTEWLWL